MKKLLIFVMTVMGFSQVAFAADLWVVSGSNIAAKYADIGVGVRASGMGNADVALSSGPEAIFENPANTSQLANESSLMLSHNSWFGDTNQETLGYVRDGMGLGTFGIAVSYINEGKINAYGTDSLGNPVKIPDISPYAMIAKLNWSKLVFEGIYAGLNINYIREDIGGSVSQMGTFDIGMKYLTPVNGLSLGIAARNIGIKIDGFDVYRDLTVGAGYKLYTNNSDALSLAFDCGLPAGGGVNASFGAEYGFSKMLFLRAGYQYDRTEPIGLKDLRAGLGLKYNMFCLDYAFEPYGDLGVVNKISLSYQFGSQEAPKPVEVIKVTTQEKTMSKTVEKSKGKTVEKTQVNTQKKTITKIVVKQTTVPVSTPTPVPVKGK
jgi:hypothetical protein